MATSREKRWRDKLKPKLVSANLWKEFNEKQLAYRREHGCTTQKAWVETAIAMDLRPNWKDYLAADNARKERLKLAAAKRAVVKEPDLPDNSDEVMKIIEESKKPDPEEELQRERDLIANTIPNVVVQDDGVFNPIRDAEWVYRNMNRLFIVDKRLGIERLDEEVLKEAPSNAAVGLAANALADKQRFYREYGLVLLKRSEKEDDESESEEALIEELDPSFRGLERYLAEKVPKDDVEVLASDLGKTETA